MEWQVIHEGSKNLNLITSVTWTWTIYKKTLDAIQASMEVFVWFIVNLLEVAKGFDNWVYRP